MFVDLFNGVLDESISFDFFLYSFDDIVDILLIFAGRIVLSVDRLFKSERFLIGAVGSVWWRNVFFTLIGYYLALTISFGSHLIFFDGFMVAGTIEDIFVFG